MNRVRLVAAVTAALTALLLQATVVGPVGHSVPVSLPAVLVACVALVDGAGTGLAFGFVLGLLADLGSAHPAGVLALTWLAVGLVCGTVAWHSVPRGAVAVGPVCAAATMCSTVFLAVLGDGGATFLGAVESTLPTALADGLLALVLIPVVRVFLRSEWLRAPAPVFTELVNLGPLHD